MVSLIRALLVIPIIYTLRNPDWATYTFILIVIGVLSDALDGYLARRAHEVTHFGKWLDPIADFVVIFSIASYLVLIGRFPLWFYWFFSHSLCSHCHPGHLFAQSISFHPTIKLVWKMGSRHFIASHNFARIPIKTCGLASRSDLVGCSYFTFCELGDVFQYLYQRI